LCRLCGRCYLDRSRKGVAMLNLVLLTWSTAHAVLGGAAGEANWQAVRRCDWGAIQWAAWAQPKPQGTVCRCTGAPVFVSPCTSWAVPNSCLTGPDGNPVCGN